MKISAQFSVFYDVGRDEYELAFGSMAEHRGIPEFEGTHEECLDYVAEHK